MEQICCFLSVFCDVIDWGLTALSAQICYIVPLISILQLKSEINETMVIIIIIIQAFFFISTKLDIRE